ncbi:hypothetical protein D3C73_1216750 [compost metagenome]
MIKEVLVADDVLDYAIQLLMNTHPTEDAAPDHVKKYVRFGSGPRGIQSIISVSKVRAFVAGRFHVSKQDIAAVAFPALRHRLILNFEGQAMGVSTDAVIRAVIDGLGSER